MVMKRAGDVINNDSLIMEFDVPTGNTGMTMENAVVSEESSKMAMENTGTVMEDTGPVMEIADVVMENDGKRDEVPSLVLWRQ